MKYKLEPNHKLLGEKFKAEYGPSRFFGYNFINSDSQKPVDETYR
jgi:hypothetical protein